MKGPIIPLWAFFLLSTVQISSRRQVLAAGERHPGGAQRHHRHAVQPAVRQDRGGEPGQREPGTLQHVGVRGHGGGRAGLHALLHQR